MDRLNSHFFRPLQLAPRVISGDSQSTLVDRLEVSPSRSRLLTSPHRISSGDSTTGLGPHCWDVSLIASQQPVYNLQLVRAGTQNYLICAGKLCHCARSNWREIMCSKKVPLTKHMCSSQCFLTWTSTILMRIDGSLCWISVFWLQFNDIFVLLVYLID
jgi:hypothetical protein